jgi:hypothetical protein
MSDVEALKNLIRQAFADVSYPGDGHLVAHANYGDEYALTKEAFRGWEDWQTLDSPTGSEPGLAPRPDGDTVGCKRC